MLNKEAARESRLLRQRIRMAAYYKANREHISTHNAKRYRASPDKKRAAVAAWTKANPDKKRASLAARRASQIKATPLWADKEIIQDMYAEAGYQQLQVDHIVPLRSKKVCGLHWEGNLQLLSAVDNGSKGNCQWPGM